jgi:Flp pilus assembly protein TadD
MGFQFKTLGCSFETKTAFSLVLILACAVATVPRLCAQASGSGQNQPPSAPQGTQPGQTPSRVEQQTNQNPFPEDTSDIPVMPNKSTADLPPDIRDAASRVPMPAVDVDPARSPETAAATAENQEQSSSSSLAGMRDLLPSDDDDTQTAKRAKKGEQAEPEHHESAAEDESVGKYYLDNKDWKAALSRFQSALVLDPDNPDVYWGLAEAEPMPARITRR